MFACRSYRRRGLGHAEDAKLIAELLVDVFGRLPTHRAFAAYSQMAISRRGDLDPCVPEVLITESRPARERRRVAILAQRVARRGGRGMQRREQDLDDLGKAEKTHAAWSPST